MGRRATLFPYKTVLDENEEVPSASFCFDLVKEGNRKIFSVKLPVTKRAK